MKKHLIYLVCLLVFAWGCNSNKADEHAGHNHDKESHAGHNHEAEGHTHGEEGHDCDHDHGAKDKTAENHSDEIIFTPEQAKAVGLEVITVKPDRFHQVIKTSGQILSAQGDEVTVSATTNGIVSFNKASLNEGLSVKAGESLLSISSRNIVDGDPVLKAKSAYEIAQLEYQRAEALIADKLISQKEFNELKLNYENTKTAYGNFATRQGAKGVGISSPIGGFVKLKLVSEGQYVEVGQPLVTVTQNRKLQLRADVSERYYKDLGNITTANFKTPYDKAIHRLSDLNGRLVSYGRSANTQEYYVPVNFEFDNIGQIISGSYVEVFLISGVKQQVISIPVSSLTEDQGIYFVYIQLDEEGYKKQEVKLGASDGDRVEILSGLKEGDIVVSKGAYHVKLASASAAIPHGHEH
ncbi:efflux RND transporter periplasmic adaptor subunit [Dysgonomonas sp. ZJ709]|uniref:efflux RND transporter periplasmic adaptor subunit n=1 Tax=Dysgonomonas sp. ZJ709 TaxID=2709797 RepID=UPI0013EC9346|nr:efflux RND transporter periplasmic adaptor subunit [Dysgonomonas sp. ZJ709]